MCVSVVRQDVSVVRFRFAWYLLHRANIRRQVRLHVVPLVSCIVYALLREAQKRMNDGDFER